MDEPDAPKPRPTLKPDAEAARLARIAREAAALRANLHRRKAQARAQAAPPRPAPGPDGDAS